MPFSLRLDPDTEARIRRLSADTGQSRSAVVREAVAQYSAMREADARTTRSADDRLKPFVGVVSTGGRDLSTDTHAKYRALLERTHRGETFSLTPARRSRCSTGATPITAGARRP